MTAARYPVIRCDGEENLGGPCGNEVGFPGAITATGVRRGNPDWHQRPGGRDICPDCWEDGQR